MNVVDNKSEHSKRTQAHTKARNTKANQELNNQFLAFLPTRQRVSSPSENENLKSSYLGGSENRRGKSRNLKQASVNNDGRSSNAVMEPDQELAS